MITIFGELTSLNEYINAERRNRFIGAKKITIKNLKRL